MRAGERTGDRSREEDPSRDAATLLSGRQDPHCTGRPARRGQYRRAMPPRGDRPEPLLPLVERLSRGREEATGWRYGPGRDLGRGQGPASRGQRAEGGRGRAHPRKSSAQKKRDGGWGGSHMRYPASEKFEIIRLVEESALPVRRTLEKIGIPRATFYRWYDLYQAGGPEALDDRHPKPDRVLNRIPDDVRDRIISVALDGAGLDKARVLHRPRLLSDNGSSYISDDLAKWLERHDMAHVRGAPYHPMTQGKIERWHQTLKNRILLENYYLPGDPEAQIEAFVADYNHRRYHESIGNLTPADVYFGRGQTILLQRERIKRQTMPNAACSTNGKPRNVTNQRRRSLP